MITGLSGRKDLMRRSTFLLILTIAPTILLCDPAMAYIGPGAGVTMLGALWSVLVAIVLAIGAVIFWPVRILIRRFRNRSAKAASEKAASSAPASKDSD
jgi:hypothetical protein